MNSNISPFGRVLIIALISGLISGIVVTAIMWFVFSSAFLLLIIPAVMGWSLEKFAHLKPAEVQADDRHESKVGWTCAGITLSFVVLTAFVDALVIYFVTGNMWNLLMNVVFYLVAGVSVWYGYRKGVQVVVDSRYE